MDEKETYLEALASKTQENMADEAEAIKGYTEQSAIIRQIGEKYPDLAGLCEDLANKTDELIADELNHQQKLNAMYTAITGIPAKE